MRRGPGGGSKAPGRAGAGRLRGRTATANRLPALRLAQPEYRQDLQPVRRAADTPNRAARSARLRARQRAPKWALIAGLLGFLVLCGIVLAIFARGSQRSELTGVVQEVRWERAIPIEALVDVEYQDWRDEIPANATIGTCKQAFRYESAEPEPNSEEVCGTPYTVDQGSGYAQVVQECVYRVFADSCVYRVPEWRVVETLNLSGTDYNPQWPAVSLSEGQRQSQEWSETYTVWFQADDERYTYRVRELEAFLDFQPGSQWTLLVNGFGDLVGVEQ
jgi:hypothetical protein